MCIVLFQWQPEAATPLIAAVNRDEFHARPTEPARWRGEIFCGLDLRAGGTWLGITRTGRFAALTNYREPANTSGALSRGALPMAFLQSTQSPQDFLQDVHAQQTQYSGFNLLVGTTESLWYMSNRGSEPQAVSPGVHALSNAQLDTPWPKTERGHARLSDALHKEASLPTLLEVMYDRHQPEDHTLPDTGVGIMLERLVAPVFITSENYGTRSSSAVALHKTQPPHMLERRFDSSGTANGESISTPNAR